jgi:signal transduction histidine kinase
MTGVQMLIERLEAFFERLYRRLGPRYITVYIHVSCWMTCAVAASLLPVLLPTFAAPSGAETLRALVVLVGLWIVVGAVILIPLQRRSFAPVDLWLRGSRHDAHTRDAWRRALSLPRHIGQRGIPAGVAGLILPYAAYLFAEFRLSALAVGLAFVAMLAVGLWGSVVFILGGDLYLQPLRRDLARSLRGSQERISVRAPLGAKLLLAVVLISLLTGASVAYAATARGGTLEELGRYVLLTLVVTFTSSGVLIVLLTRSMLAPIDDLLTATREVRSGDLSARADITTDDEIGVLAMNFNAMLAELERASDETRASRARIVAASDVERKRIERNIHDGAQQKLVALALQLRMLQDRLTDPDLEREAQAAIENLQVALEELRELARGLHPSVLSTDGLRPALEQLADKTHVPVVIDAPRERFPESIESTAYFVASEALANVTKHSSATSVKITVGQADRRVILEVTDDGVGGASIGAGSGLTGLHDRVEAIGGTLSVQSSAAHGTTVTADLPLQ